MPCTVNRTVYCREDRCFHFVSKMKGFACILTYEKCRDFFENSNGKWTKGSLCGWKTYALDEWMPYSLDEWMLYPLDEWMPYPLNEWKLYSLAKYISYSPQTWTFSGSEEEKQVFGEVNAMLFHHFSPHFSKSQNERKTEKFVFFWQNKEKMLKYWFLRFSAKVAGDVW